MKKKFTKEFKEEAVKMVLNGERTMTDIADSLGLKIWHLSNWKKEYLKHQDESFPGKGKRHSSDEENHQLRKENARLKMENEILKKATAIFSRQK